MFVLVALLALLLEREIDGLRVGDMPAVDDDDGRRRGERVRVSSGMEDIEAVREHPVR